MKATSKASWPDIGCYGGGPGKGQVGSTGEGCVAARAMMAMHMLLSMASVPGTGWVEEHLRGVHGKCASVWQ